MAKSMIGLKPLHSRILVGIYDDGDTSMMLGGKKFYLLDDTSDAMKRSYEHRHSGIRPRYGIVLSISDHVEENYPEVTVGAKVLMEHGRWTRGMYAHVNGDEEKTARVWSIPVEDVYMVMDGGFKENELEQIARLYPDWQTWEESAC